MLEAVVGEFLNGLESAGIRTNGDRCHWCGQRDVPDCMFIEGRATRICDICIDHRRKRMAAARPLTGAGAAAALIAASIAMIPSAAIAATLQLTWDGLLNWWTDGRDAAIHLPHLVALVLLFGYGAAVAAPIGLILRKIPSRGNRFAAILAFVFCLFAALLAEVFVVAWLLGNRSEWLTWEFIEFALRVTCRNAGVGLVFRVLLAAIAGMCAAIMASPKAVPFFDE